jgi:hypothetical protein
VRKAVAVREAKGVADGQHRHERRVAGRRASGRRALWVSCQIDVDRRRRTANASARVQSGEGAGRAACEYDECDGWQRHDLPDPGGTIILTPPAD